MTVRLIPVLRCKEAIDLIGDALLKGHKADLDAIERHLMWALEFGCGNAMVTPAKERRLNALVKQWKQEKRKAEIKKLREETA